MKENDMKILQTTELLSTNLKITSTTIQQTLEWVNQILRYRQQENGSKFHHTNTPNHHLLVLHNHDTKQWIIFNLHHKWLSHRIEEKNLCLEIKSNEKNNIHQQDIWLHPYSMSIVHLDHHRIGDVERS